MSVRRPGDFSQQTVSAPRVVVGPFRYLYLNILFTISWQTTNAGRAEERSAGEGDGAKLFAHKIKTASVL